MKRNKESKARIRIINTFKLDKTEQRLCDEFVEKMHEMHDITHNSYDKYYKSKLDLMRNLKEFTKGVANFTEQEVAVIIKETIYIDFKTCLGINM